MLSLGRFKNQKVAISFPGRAPVELVVQKVGRETGLVQLGFSGPPSVIIDRFEVHQRKLAEAAAAPSTSTELQNIARRHAAVFASDLLQLRQGADAKLGRLKAYTAAIEAISAGVDCLVDLGRILERGEVPAPVTRETPGPVVFGDLDGGEMLGRGAR